MCSSQATGTKATMENLKLQLLCLKYAALKKGKDLSIFVFENYKQQQRCNKSK